MLGKRFCRSYLLATRSLSTAAGLSFDLDVFFLNDKGIKWTNCKYKERKDIFTLYKIDICVYYIRNSYEIEKKILKKDV